MRRTILPFSLAVAFVVTATARGDVVLESNEPEETPASTVIERLRGEMEPQEEAAAQEEAMPAPEPIATGRIERASFTTAVFEREPIDSITELFNDHEQVYYFTEFRGMAGRTLVHRWEYNGQVVAEVPFDCGGDRWRVYSSKKLNRLWLGEWRVSVVDPQQGVLRSDTFSYTEAPVEPPAANEAPAYEPDWQEIESLPAAPPDVPE